MLLADDVIVTVNGTHISCVKDFKSVISSLVVGDFVSLDLLRRSSPPAQQCPAGHVLKVLEPSNSLYQYNTVSLCNDYAFIY